MDRISRIRGKIKKKNFFTQRRRERHREEGRKAKGGLDFGCEEWDE